MEPVLSSFAGAHTPEEIQERPYGATDVAVGQTSKPPNFQASPLVSFVENPHWRTRVR